MKYIVILFVLFPVFVHGQSNAEWYVREYFHDAPDLIAISRCESTFRQFDDKGNVLRGKVNNSDVGAMQINAYYHQKTAEKLGYDIYTLEGNLGFAKWLYEKYGSDPWSASEPCWGEKKFNSQVCLAKN